jgi:hypothetical protein
VNYSLNIDEIITFFDTQFEEMKNWYEGTGEVAVFSHFPWNNKNYMINEIRKISEININQLLHNECDEIGDLDTKLHMNISDANIKTFLEDKDFPTYAALFFLSREKCGPIKLDTILTFLKKRGEKTDLGASVLDRTFLSKLIHSDKSVLEKICWELIFIILKNEHVKIYKRIRRLIIFYFIFEKNKHIFPEVIDSKKNTDFLLNMCIAQEGSPGMTRLEGGGATLLSQSLLDTKIDESKCEFQKCIQSLEIFNHYYFADGKPNGWEYWTQLKKKHFPQIFPEIFDVNSEFYIKNKLGDKRLVDFAIKGFMLIKQLIKTQTTLNSLILTNYRGFGGMGLPYQNLAQNIIFIKKKMNKFLEAETGLNIYSFTNKDNYIEIGNSIKNVIVSLATDPDMAQLSEHMKTFYKHNNGEEKGPSTFSYASRQVPIEIQTLKPDLKEKLAIIGLSINKLTIQYPKLTKSNIPYLTEDKVARILAEGGPWIPYMTDEEASKILTNMGSWVPSDMDPIYTDEPPVIFDEFVDGVVQASLPKMNSRTGEVGRVTTVQGSLMGPSPLPSGWGRSPPGGH